MNLDLPRLWPRAEPILDAVLDLPEPRRSARVAELCAGSPEMERIVAQLLRADLTTDRFLNAMPFQFFDSDETELETPPHERSGSEAVERIGPFRITRELGRGGMGTVLLGERDDGQFEQRVAIKLLHGEWQSDAARETLLRERRVLARLEHPHIARMYDGGVTAANDPYFIMEYIDGRSIDQHCTELRLGTGDRLRLFRDVCRAIEYAHGRLVVHCDLKPHNILVTPRGEVKLVDFGIAHLLQLEDEGSAATASGQRLLTPAYAAPEQLAGVAVTAATDVYQLGLVLYELLTGQRAFGAVTPRPSAVDRRLAGDIDAIVLKTLERDPAQRYATVEALRRDIDAYLELQPVSARRGSSGYRLQKYVQRHRWGVVAALAVGVSLAIGLAAVTVQSRIAQRERDRARAAQGRATAVNDFVVRELLRAPMPEASLGRDLTVAEVLQNAVRSVGYALHEQPETEADVRLVLARTYQALGRGKDAVVQAQAAFDLFAGNADVSPTAMQAAERTLAELAIDNGQYASASETLTALRDRQRATLGADAVDTLMTTAALALALNELNEFSRAEALLRQDLPAAQRAPAESWRLVIELQRQLVRALVAQDHPSDAEPLCRSMLSSLEQHAGPEHPDRIGVLSMLASSLSAVGRYPEATAAFQDAVALSRTVFGERHPATARTLLAQSNFFNRRNRHVEARAAAEEALSIFRDALGPDHPLALSALWRIAAMKLNEGHSREAEPLFRQVAAARRRSLGPTHPLSIAALDTLGIVLLNQGRESEARSTQREVLALYEQAVAPENADPQTIGSFTQYLMTVKPDDLQDPAYARRTAERAVTATQRRDSTALVLLAEVESRNGNNDKVMPLLREALALPEARLRRWAERDAVEFLEQTATPVEVESFLRQRLQDELMPPAAPEDVRAATLRLLGLHLQKQQKLDEAERCLSEALELRRHVFPADDWTIGDAQSELGGCIAARRDFARAEPLLLEGFRLIEGQAVRAAKSSLPAARARLVELYEAWGRADEAQRWRAISDR